MHRDRVSTWRATGASRSRSSASQPFHWFVTVCDEAQKRLPVLPGVENVAHWSIEDPSLVTRPPEERLEAFRTARDRIRDRLHIFLLAAGRDDLPTPEAATLG